MTETELSPNGVNSAEFLCWLNPNTPAYLENMASSGAANPRATTKNSCAVDDIAGYVNKHNCAARRNIYFVPNAEFLIGKRKKANVSAARFLHVDLDFKDYPGEYEEQRARVEALLFDDAARPEWIPHPTAVWMTGGGYQAVWRLEEEIDPETAETLNKAILRALQGGPGTHNVDRLLRLPDTVNWLNARKRKDGREPVLGFLAYPESFADPPTSYRVDQFEPPIDVVSEGLASNSKDNPEQGPIQPVPLPENTDAVLPEDPEWRRAVVNGIAPKGKSYATRSELMFAATIWMLAQGLTSGHVLAVLLDPRFAIGDHIRDRNDGAAEQREYAERQVRRAQGVVAADNDNWPSITEKGLPTSNSAENIRHALSKLGVSVRRNEFTEEDEFEGLNLEGRDINEIADILASNFERELHFKASSAAIRRELLASAHEHRHHPVHKYLDRSEWDGVSRLDTWLSDFCGVADTPLHREFAAKTMIGAVRRIRKPGCKFDTMLVLEGTQGVGKSRLLRIMAVRDAWFCESLNLRADDRERAQVLQRAWIVECQELDGLNKVTSENLKKFLSESIDTFRKPYEKNARQHPRHCVLIGTTNETDYLRDLTGNRRFWPVRVGSIDLEGFQAVVGQLWAEAAHREAAGEEVTLSAALWSEAAKVQSQRVAEDPYADALTSALGGMVGKVSMDSIKVILGLPTTKLTPHDARRIKAVMGALGWSYGTFRLWLPAREERRPVRGFTSENADGSLPEIAARPTREGSYEIGMIDRRGNFVMERDSGHGTDHVPF